jgi:hypothetical protein
MLFSAERVLAIENGTANFEPACLAEAQADVKGAKAF